MITFVLLLLVIFYHSYRYTTIYRFVKKTRFYGRLHNLKSKIFKPQPKETPPPKQLQIQDREVDIFELVDRSPDTNDYQLAQPQPEPPKPVPTVSTVEIPRPREEQSPNLQEFNKEDHRSTIFENDPGLQEQLEQEINQARMDVVTSC